MKLILRLFVDNTDRYDLGWRDEQFFGIISATLKNPHGYDEVEAIDLTFDGRERKLKLKKDNKEHEINLKVWKEHSEDKSVLVAEIWPVIVSISM
jgi:hypothetical protein